MTGVRYYIGQPGSGKTTLAAAHAADLCGQTGWPVLVIDSAGVAQLDHVPRARSAPDALDQVWNRRAHAAWTPSDVSEVENVCASILQRGRLIVLVDEAAYWISSRRSGAPSLLRLMRAHRHAQVFLLLTTQHFSADVPQEAVSCAPDLYVFACTSPAVLDRLERDYGLDRRTVASLPRGHFVHVETGFPS